MEFFLSAEQMKGTEQPHQSEVMITVQMGNKNVPDPLDLDLLPAQLHLRALPAIDQKELVVHVDHLSRGIVSACGRGRPAAEYGNFKRHGIKNRLPGETVLLGSHKSNRLMLHQHAAGELLLTCSYAVQINTAFKIRGIQTEVVHAFFTHCFF
jgi:hypothetical protein